MEKIYLSKFKYCRAIQCNKMLWLDKNKPEERDELDYLDDISYQFYILKI